MKDSNYNGRYWLMREVWAVIGEALGEGCGYACHEVAAGGWIAEADCPIHDSQKRWHEILFRVINWIVK